MMKRRKFHWEQLGSKMAEVFRAVGDVNRMMIIKILAENPEQSLRVTDIGEIVGISQPAASQHLRVLKSVGILTANRIGNKTYYSIDSEQLQEYRRIIDHMFKMAVVKCKRDGDCENCPIKTKYCVENGRIKERK